MPNDTGFFIRRGSEARGWMPTRRHGLPINWHAVATGAREGERKQERVNAACLSSLVRKARAQVTVRRPHEGRGGFTPLARRVSTHKASSSTAITHSAVGGFAACRRCASNRRPHVSLRSTATARLSDFRSALTLCFRSMDLTREWRWTRNEKSLVPSMTTDLAPVSRLTREIRGLQQLGHCEHHRAALSLA
jgi:hypothetical protein